MTGGVDFFKHNCRLLKKRYPHIYDMLSRLNWPTIGELKHTIPQAPNLEISLPDTTVALHPSDCPNIEGLEQLERVPQDGYGVVLWMGLGLGYGPQNILEKRPNLQFLIIFEVDPGILVQAMHARDLTWLFANPRVLFHLGTQIDIEKVLLPAKNSLLMESIYCLKHRKSVELMPKAYQKLEPIVFNYANNLNVIGSTILEFGSKIFTNRLQNLSLMKYTNILEDLKGVFKGVPAYLVSAGPSLNKSVDELKRIQGSGLILAVDAAVPVLLEAGIMPHFVGALDSHDIIFEKACAYISKLDQTVLICGSTVTPLVSKRFPPGKICWAFTKTYMDNWLNKQLGGSLVMTKSNQVADMNLFAAIVMGCSPIVLVGQDLCFESEGQSHAAGAVISSNGPVRFGGDKDEPLIPVPGNYAAEVKTNRVFLDGIRTFEHVIEEYPGQYINATDGGAYIKGTEVMPLTDVLERYSKESIEISIRLKDQLRTCMIGRQAKFDRLFSQIKGELTSLKRKINSIDQTYHKIQPEINRMVKHNNRPKSFSQLPSKLKKKSNEIVNGFNKISGKIVLEMFSEITLKTMKEAQQKTVQLEQIAGDPNQYMAWLAGNLKSMIKINRARLDIIDSFLNKIASLTGYWRACQQLEAKREKTQDSKDCLELIKEYAGYGDWTLAIPLINQLEKDGIHEPELEYYSAVLALYYENFKAAELGFKHAETDTVYATQIDNLRKSWGDLYMQNALWAQEINTLELKRKMVVKGLQVSPDHAELKNLMQDCLREDILSCTKSLENNQVSTPDTAPLLIWEESFNNNESLIELVSEENLSDFYQLMIQRDSASQEYEKALEWCQNLSEIEPENADIYFKMADLFYSMNDLDMTLIFLKKSIAFEPAYIEAWYNLGDDLQGAQLYDKAMKVFEQGFITMPQQVNFLKKMGDCYSAMGETEAAQEAYRQYNARQ